MGRCRVSPLDWLRSVAAKPLLTGWQADPLPVFTSKASAAPLIILSWGEGDACSLQKRKASV